MHLKAIKYIGTFLDSRVQLGLNDSLYSDCVLCYHTHQEDLKFCVSLYVDQIQVTRKDKANVELSKVSGFREVNHKNTFLCIHVIGLSPFLKVRVILLLEKQS